MKSGCLPLPALASWADDGEMIRNSAVSRANRVANIVYSLRGIPGVRSTSPLGFWLLSLQEFTVGDFGIQGLKIGDQVGEPFGRQAVDQPVRHQRLFLNDSVLYLSHLQFQLDSRRIADQQGFCTLADHETVDHFAVGHLERIGLKTLGYLGARPEDGLRQLHGAVSFADINQVRSLRRLSVGDGGARSE